MSRTRAARPGSQNPQLLSSSSRCGTKDHDPKMQRPEAPRFYRCPRPEPLTRPPAPQCGKTTLDGGLTQGLELLLFCGHHQGEAFWAEAGGEADKGLLGPGQVAHQGEEAERVGLGDSGLPADQEPAGEGESPRGREGPGSTCGDTSIVRLFRK